MFSCNLCSDSKLRKLIDFGYHPVAKHYLHNKNQEEPVWPVKLYFCDNCGLTQLKDSCPSEVLYDNYVTLSTWKFQPHVQHEIELINRLDGINSNSTFIEIGSNDGMFLEQMAKNGYENTMGVEPANDAYKISLEKKISTINEFLTPELSISLKDKYGQFDMFISRQNMEHISDLKGMVESIKTLVKPNGYVLIEVPNFSCNLKTRDYSLWEEHVNYFTKETLEYFLSLAGIKIVHHENILFSGEGIIVVGQNVNEVDCSIDYVPDLRKRSIEYGQYWNEFKINIHNYFNKLRNDKKKIAVYGAGSRVFCLINFTDIAKFIEIIVDDQLEKQNKYMPGGKLPIKSSNALYDESVDICLLAVNTENEEKVIKKHKKWLEKSGVFWSVLPPSDRLLPVWHI